jgi:hypothetical protein
MSLGRCHLNLPVCLPQDDRVAYRVA